MEPAALGIDFGSYSTRACIWARGKDYIVENKAHIQRGMGVSTYYAADFPSTIYPFDAGPAYLDEVSWTRPGMSGKYSMYCFAGASDELLEQYPLVRQITDRRGDKSLEYRLRRGVRGLFETIRQAAVAICQVEKLRITKIGLTIPVQWTLDFETSYREIVSQAFSDIDPAQIHFFTESEALARYLFRYHNRELDPTGKRYGSMMFLDFGGHNMNGSLFTIARDAGRPEDNSFFRLGKPFGAGGGSEQWEYHIVEWFAEWYPRHHGIVAPLEERRELLNKFQGSKKLDPRLGHDVSWFSTNPRNGTVERVTLGSEDIVEAWNKAHEHPLRVAREQIARLVRLVARKRTSKPLIVVSGGTARNPRVKEQIKKACEAHRLPVLFTDEFKVSIQYDSAKIAKAASFVASQTLSVMAFFERGAAIGLQRQDNSLLRGKKRDKRWDDCAQLLIDPANLGVEPTRVFNEFTGRERIQLICDPFFGKLPLSQRKTIEAERSYDLLYLGRREKGKWRFTAKVEEGGGNNSARLILEQFHQPPGKKVWNRATTLTLPLYLDASSNCIHVGARDKDISELELVGVPQQPTRWDSDENPNDDDDDLDDDGDDEVTLQTEGGDIFDFLEVSPDPPSRTGQQNIQREKSPRGGIQKPSRPRREAASVIWGKARRSKK